MSTEMAAQLTNAQSFRFMKLKKEKSGFRTEIIENNLPVGSSSAKGQQVWGGRFGDRFANLILSVKRFVNILK